MRCDVSVIVPTYNEEADIMACLEAIRAQKTHLSYEIIVSDSKSTDATCDIASRYADKLVVIPQRGIGTGRNAGAHVARGEHLLFVDGDTMLPKNYLEDAHSKFSDTKLVAFSGKFKFSPRTKKGILAERVMDAYYKIYARAGKALMLGFNTNVRHNAFDKVGGYRAVPIRPIFFNRRAEV